MIGSGPEPDTVSRNEGKARLILINDLVYVPERNLMNFRGRFSSPLNRLNSGTRARKSRRLGARALSAMLAAGALVAAPLVGAAPALAADEPSVTVSPDTELDPEGPNTLTVTGEGFTPGELGVYAAVGPASAKDIEGWQSDASLFTALDRKNTRLNSSHVATSYADLCLKDKTIPNKSQ